MKNRYKILLGSVALCCLIGLFGVPTASGADIKQGIVDFLDKGDTTRAIEMLEQEVNLDPGFEKNYYTLGLIYKKRGQLEKAEELFEKAVEKKKKFWEGVYELGMVKMQLGKVEEAEEQFKTGLKKSKKLKHYFHSGMAQVYLSRKEYNDADKEIRKAIVIDDKIASFHIIMGEIYVDQGVNSLAASSFEKAIALDTLSLDIYFDWAEACLEMKNYKCALEKLSVVLTKDSTHAPAWMRAGGIYYKAARSSRNVDEIKELYGKTIAAYEKYLELAQAVPDSTNGRAYYEAGMAYLKLRYYKEAQEYFDKVLAIPVIPKDIYFNFGASWQGVARLLQQEGQKSESIIEYDSAITYMNMHIGWVREMQAQGEFESAIKDVELYRKIGECYEAKKDRFNTIKYYKKSLEYNQDQARLLYGVAVAYNYTQDYANALLYYMKRIDQGMDERYWSIYYNAATSALYLSEKGPGAMEEDEDLGLEEDEDIEDTPIDDPFAGIDFVDLAIGYLEKITVEHWDYVTHPDRFERNKGLVIKALGMLGSNYLYQKKDCTTGIKYLEQVLELDSGNCEALRSMGYAYYGGICNTNYTKALNYLDRALKCMMAKGDAKCKDIEMLLWIAGSYEFRALDKLEAGNKDGKKADYAKADEWYLEISKCDPNNNEAKEGHRRCKWEH